MGLLNALQAASNTAADTVAAPVDGLAWLLRRMGVPVNNPVGGSDWMRQQGLTAPVQPGASKVAGETFGLLAPTVAVAKAPQIAAGLLKMGENAAAPGTLSRGMAGSQRGAIPAINPNADEAMSAVGYERGWWRGGPEIKDGKMSGPWYTRIPEEAADYARRTPNSEVREYALPAKSILRFDRSYPSRLAHDIASDVQSMGPEGAKFASLLRSGYGADDVISGAEAWRGLAKWLGDDVAAEVLAKRGFRGVEGLNNPQYMRLLPGATARDANRAKFDPARMKVDDIFGAADPALLAAIAGLTGGVVLGNRAGE
jgi:hypothetical protein